MIFSIVGSIIGTNTLGSSLSYIGRFSSSYWKRLASSRPSFHPERLSNVKLRYRTGFSCFPSVSRLCSSGNESSVHSSIYPSLIICFVSQIRRQFPLSFEFNDFYLRTMAYHVFSMRFHTFTLDSEKDRCACNWLPYRYIIMCVWLILVSSPLDHAHLLHMEILPL